MMFRYGKMTRAAISAMSRLAELFDSDVRVSSLDVARARNLSKPLVAKVLTVLSQAGLVNGSPGPSGGYRLARPPEEISLLDVARLFERERDESACPFGPGWCGRGAPCPLHDPLQALDDHMLRFLRDTTLHVFQRVAADGTAERPA
jgi:Rrf2 family protein